MTITITLYLSGPMAGLPDHNFPAFMVAAALLRGRGYTVSNPAEYGEDPALPRSDCLRRDLHDVLNADALAVLPGWESSRGATLEVYVARALGMEVHSVDVWADRSELPGDWVEVEA